MNLTSLIDWGLVILVITCLLRFFRFAVTESILDRVQSAADTAAIWLDYRRPVLWYAALRNRTYIYLLSVVFLISTSNFIIEFVRRAVAAMPEGHYGAPIAFVAGIYLGRRAHTLGDIQLRLIAGEGDEYYKIPHTLARFTSNVIRAIAGLAIPTVVLFALFAVAMWFMPGQTLGVSGVIGISLLVVTFFVWELLTVLLIALALFTSTFVIAVLHGLVLVLRWWAWKVALHKSGAFTALIILATLVVGIASLAVRVSERREAAQLERGSSQSVEPTAPRGI